MLSAPALPATATSPLQATAFGTERFTYSLARSRSELTQAFRLVFQSYYEAGLVDQKPSGIRLTPHHLLPTSEVMLGKLGDVVVSTVSMFGDGYLGLPMQSMYPSEVKELRDQGLRLAEIGCLAATKDSPLRFIEIVAQMERLVTQVARARGIDALVIATHPKHARLYKRMMGFKQIGDLSDCPYANGNPAVPLCLQFNEHIGTPLYERYFENPYPEHQLEQFRWDRETRAHFRDLLEKDTQSTFPAGISGYYNWAVISGVLT